MARLLNARTLVLGAAALATAAALKNRHKVAGLLGGGTSEPEPYNPPGPAPAPPIANADASGPPENTATPVPAPEPVVEEQAAIEGLDEEAEERAAAAEAANIGGPAPEYVDDEGAIADEEERSGIEAGEGVSEGFEQAEADLIDNAEPAAGDPIEAERQIDEVIEAQDEPFSGETPDAVEPAGVDGETDPGGAADTEVHEDQLSIDSPVPGTPAPTTQDSLAAGTTEEGAPTTGGTLSGLSGPAGPPSAGDRVDAPPPQTSAAEKSSNVWRVADDPSATAPGSSDIQPPISEQPTVEQDALEKGGAKADQDDEDDGNEWQTWSGRAVDS